MIANLRTLDLGATPIELNDLVNHAKNQSLNWPIEKNYETICYYHLRDMKTYDLGGMFKTTCSDNRKFLYFYDKTWLNANTTLKNCLSTEQKTYLFELFDRTLTPENFRNSRINIQRALEFLEISPHNYDIEEIDSWPKVLSKSEYIFLHEDQFPLS